jgi:hypothetical protein
MGAAKGITKGLELFGRIFPGDYMKTLAYRALIYKPRRFLWTYTNAFYRMDHVYEVLREYKNRIEGNFSVLEFGVADGYSFTKTLYAVKYLGLEKRVAVHGFDTFEGLPEVDEDANRSLVSGGGWKEGMYRGRFEELNAYCEKKYKNWHLHRGLFSDTLSEAVLETLLEDKPALIWIDCDLYESTKSVFEKLIPYIPTGCAVYFDDIYYNFSSRFTGEMRVVDEINRGVMGEGIELVPDRDLSWGSNRIYRFINLNAKTQHRLKETWADGIRYRTNDSPFP